MTDNLTALAAPFDPEIISWRVGSTNAAKTSGMALGYIDARDVMERLDTVVGPANWQDRYEFHGKRSLCYLSIRVDGEWITKADGAGDSDVESEKGAISDALKRAAVKWGIGRYLYDLSSPWVDIESAGRSYRIKPSERSKLVAAAKAGASVANRLAAEREAEKVAAEAVIETKPAPLPAAPPTLADRAATFIKVMQGVSTSADLEKAWALGSGLCADLDLKAPETLAEVTAAYEARRDDLSTPFNKAA